AREDQDGGVDRAEFDVEPLVRIAVNLAVVDTVEDVGHEQRGEEQHLLREEQPDSELAGIELVLSIVVVVLDERRAVMAVGVVVRMSVVRGAHFFSLSSGTSQPCVTEPGLASSSTSSTFSATGITSPAPETFAASLKS